MYMVIIFVIKKGEEYEREKIKMRIVVEWRSCNELEWGHVSRSTKPQTKEI